MHEFMRRLKEIEAASAVRTDYQKTLLLLAALKAGEVTLDQVTLIEDGWRVAEVQYVITEDKPAQTPCLRVDEPEDVAAAE